MIPYEELVIALQSWRAKQGLPVGQLSAVAMPPPASAPMTPQRSGPPAAPPKSGSTGPQQAFGNVATPEPLAAAEELDVEDAALLEEAQYDPHALDDGESTSIGTAPTPRTSEPTLDDGDARPGSNRSRNEDW